MSPPSTHYPVQVPSRNTFITANCSLKRTAYLALSLLRTCEELALNYPPCPLFMADDQEAARPAGALESTVLVCISTRDSDYEGGNISLTVSDADESGAADF